jgi:hypothetical protein
MDLEVEQSSVHIQTSLQTQGLVETVIQRNRMAAVLL